MKKFDSRKYSISDFLGWFQRNEIELQPKFQRRAVWSPMARSFLLDTIIRGKPIPKVFIRSKTDLKRRVSIREVVDGQQRLRSIYSYLNDEIVISKIHNKQHGGMKFSELSADSQRSILNYEISVDLLLDATDEEVLDIFARLNSYSVTLKAQEKLNAEFFGQFKQISYELAKEFYAFFENNKIFTTRQILRMDEAQLVSELLIAMVDGISTRKKVRQFYAKYDDQFPNGEERAEEFRNTIDEINRIFDGSLADSNFRRPHVFYSLFCAIYHFIYDLPEFNAPRVEINKSNYGVIKSALDEIDLIWEKKESELKPDQLEFLMAARRATTDTKVRVFRAKYICHTVEHYAGR